jgi:hypothetical protein
MKSFFVKRDLGDLLVIEQREIYCSAPNSEFGVPDRNLKPETTLSPLRIRRHHVRPINPLLDRSTLREIS